MTQQTVTRKETQVGIWEGLQLIEPPFNELTFLAETEYGISLFWWGREKTVVRYVAASLTKWQVLVPLDGVIIH